MNNKDCRFLQILMFVITHFCSFTPVVFDYPSSTGIFSSLKTFLKFVTCCFLKTLKVQHESATCLLYTNMLHFYIFSYLYIYTYVLEKFTVLQNFSVVLMSDLLNQTLIQIKRLEKVKKCNIFDSVQQCTNGRSVIHYYGLTIVFDIIKFSDL